MPPTKHHPSVMSPPPPNPVLPGEYVCQTREIGVLVLGVSVLVWYVPHAVCMCVCVCVRLI